MNTNPLPGKMLAVFCALALFAGTCLTADQKSQGGKKEKEKEKKHWAQAQKQDHKHYDRRQAQYVRYVEQQQKMHQKRLARLQAKKRLAQYRYQQQYFARLLQLHRSNEMARRQAYRNDAFFNTAFDRRYRRANAYYQTNRYGIEHLQQAARYGYAEGYQAGMADRQDKWLPGPGSVRGPGWLVSDVYQDASYGYNGLYVDQEDYTYYFREGFRHGYQDGYNNRAQYGTFVNGNYTLFEKILATILPYEMLN
jgi:hypothetical protein